MTKKQRFLYIFLIIITFGFILIHWKKYRQREEKQSLSISTKLNFKYEDLISALGGIQNITSVNSTQKVLKISYKNKQEINFDKLKAIKDISGISLTQNTISIIIGNAAIYLKDKIQKDLANE
ncbi:PTS glucose transporter subunit IIB [Metamycoplasma hyosynoviae]|uniref:PTS glucose transporter subunit IIB n=1 Tax=Metamycoplasma hyosynoviae TaxID=29559 RepID=A0A063YGU3_9BACT|nr:PTS glucose transporter subunit IIB [Metamycoplasma hyosynoviae]ASI53738.1 PTS glucose transporter subunit IIB [Metamycoplasma hyosynoviae]KDE41805.1 PTS glucose transporter subunit IIB [Metamycoplasma hyosynoviae]KDE42063.1 PTS glucose transporter subunit IIB [Metamycoplasma hyosynoviae]KDE42806.1 PTS glucose transporter subunit IIB [Metamycoplasma hyosynoviae]KDE43452.1 PTS glucose transporter subunit IIB [Metamycoplasma hyosynoviae]